MTDRMNRAKMRKLCTEEHVHKANTEQKRLKSFITIDSAMGHINDAIDAALRSYARINDNKKNCVFRLQKNGYIAESNIIFSDVLQGSTEFEDDFDAFHEEFEHLHTRLKMFYDDLFVKASISSSEPAVIFLEFDWSGGGGDAPATE